MMKPESSTPESKNLIAAIALSVAILLAWQFFYEAPRRDRAALAQAGSVSQPVGDASRGDALPVAAPAGASPAASALLAPVGAAEKPLPRAQRLQQSPRLAVRSELLHGSIALKGARFDDLTLARYRQAPAHDSAEVVLLSPAGDETTYFAEFGWTAAEAGTRLPDANTLWQADSDTLTPERPVTLKWDNGQGMVFSLKIALDSAYLFTVEQSVENRSKNTVTVMPYGLVNRAFPNLPDKYLIQHDGPLGVMDGTLKEVHYKDLRDDGAQHFAGAKGWFGITDKYWLTALVPDAAADAVTVNFSHYKSRGEERYQVDYLGKPVALAAGAADSVTQRFFAGAKEIKLLDHYAQTYHIPLFDRAVDLGVLYFLTKPIFLLLNYFYALVGNFGVAILLLTVVIKLIMYPLANKSYVAMSQMKRLQPEMNRLRERFASDKMRMNQELMALYRKEKVNPMAGCLPIIIQLPVFFALYKVLYVTIEMRHAPFFGWIHDLSAADPTNLFTLFGLLAWSPPAFLHIGIWPLIMCLTMVVQQKLNPAPSDPVQAKIMALMPFMFLFLFGSFAAGLVIYWAWSNVLSIVQQWAIMQRYNARHAERHASKAGS